MEQFMMLDQYLKMGGKIENMNLKESNCIFSDSNYQKEIQSISLGRITESNVQLYKLTFTDNTSDDYAPMWIQTVVEMALHSRFL